MEEISGRATEEWSLSQDGQTKLTNSTKLLMIVIDKSSVDTT